MNPTIALLAGLSIALLLSVLSFLAILHLKRALERDDPRCLTVRNGEKLFDPDFQRESPRESEPDGPIADSSDGYRLRPDEVLDDHDRDCTCVDCQARREDIP